MLRPGKYGELIARSGHWSDSSKCKRRRRLHLHVALPAPLDKELGYSDEWQAPRAPFMVIFDKTSKIHHVTVCRPWSSVLQPSSVVHRAGRSSHRSIHSYGKHYARDASVSKSVSALNAFGAPERVTMVRPRGAPSPTPIFMVRNRSPHTAPGTPWSEMIQS